MRYAIVLLAACALAAGNAAAQAGNAAKSPQEKGAEPKPVEESLSYTLGWPSGLSLGEARLHSTENGTSRKASLSLDASLPGFTISDSYASASEGNFCSTEFTKNFTHGGRSAEEKTAFDREQRTATRETLKPVGAGTSKFPTSACARDALAFLSFVRRELAAGRLPQTEKIYFGAPYEIGLKFAGVEKIKSGERTIDTDHLSATATGPASRIEFEIYFARDAARTPVRVDVPFSLGTFTMELVR